MRANRRQRPSWIRSHYSAVAPQRRSAKSKKPLPKLHLGSGFRGDKGEHASPKTVNPGCNPKNVFTQAQGPGQGKEKFFHFVVAIPSASLKSNAMSDDLNKAAALLGRLGGKSTSEAKKRAARMNGKKGGRPKKKRDEDKDKS